jgi:hypothetical protein
LPWGMGIGKIAPFWSVRRRISWRQASIEDARLIVPKVVAGAVVKARRGPGHHSPCRRRRRLALARVQSSVSKQVQRAIGPFSTFQQTLRRVSDPILFENPIVITNEACRFFAQQQAEGVPPPALFVLEPWREIWLQLGGCDSTMAEHAQSHIGELVANAMDKVLQRGGDHGRGTQTI